MSKNKNKHTGQHGWLDPPTSTVAFLDKMAQRVHPLRWSEWTHRQRKHYTADRNNRLKNPPGTQAQKPAKKQPAPVPRPVIAPVCESGKFCLSEEDAEKSAVELARRRIDEGGKGIAARSYKCDKCDYWHVTSKEWSKRYIE